jgi:hypothetical protein
LVATSKNNCSKARVQVKMLPIPPLFFCLLIYTKLYATFRVYDAAIFEKNGQLGASADRLNSNWMQRA